MEYTPLALKVKTILDGTYFAHKRGRRFRIKEYEITEILQAITKLENDKKDGGVAQRSEQGAHNAEVGGSTPPTPTKMLKKGDPGYQEWLDSLPMSKSPLNKKEKQ